MFTKTAAAAAALTAAVTLLAAPERAARADVVQGKDPVLMTSVVVGSIGGITSSIAAIVYAFDHRAFDNAWIVGSLFSSAVCGAMAVAFAVNAPQHGSPAVAGFVVFTALTAWPMYWTIKTAASDVDPGESFAAANEAPASTTDAFHEPRTSKTSKSALILPALAFSF